MARNEAREARTGAPQPDGNRWEGRPWVARAVRALVVVVPFVASVSAAFVLSQLVPPAADVAWLVPRLLMIVVVATATLKGVDRLMRRLLPLATLLDLTLLFPDQAPSRYRMALRNGASNVELQERIDSYHRSGKQTTASAAEHLLDLVAALSRHDRLTRGHSERVRAYSQMIGEEMGLSGLELDRLRWAGLIHDVGKLRIPTEILNKPGKLTAEEYEVIKLHPQMGAELAAPLAAWLGDSVLAVLQHHEKWDGTGYPAGLRGTEITLPGRIVAVADVFDVLTSVRSYKAACSAVEARAELARCAGSHFDPAVVRAFMSLSLGRLRFVMGPLTWIAQFSLFPQSLLATAATPAATSAATTAGTAATAASAASAATAATAATAAVGMVAASVGAMAMPMSSGQPTLRAPVARSTVVVDDVDHTRSILDETPSSTTVFVAGVDTSSVPGESASGASPPSPAGAQPATGGGGGSGTGATSDPGGEPLDGEDSTGSADLGANDHTSTTAPANAAAATTPMVVTPTSPTTAAPAPAPAPTPPPAPGTTAPEKVLPPPAPAPPAPTLPPAAPTTVAPTTVPPTTAAPQPLVEFTSAYFLFTSPVAGDTTSQELLPALQQPSQQTVLPNYDTDRDAAPGLLILRGGALATGDSAHMQRFALDPAGDVQLRGRHQVHLWVAPASGNRRDMDLAVALARCDDLTGVCTIVSTESESFKGSAGSFELVSLDFGRITQLVPVNQRLEVWVTAESSSESDLVLAYDAGIMLSGLQIKR